MQLGTHKSIWIHLMSSKCNKTLKTLVFIFVQKLTVHRENCLETKRYCQVKVNQLNVVFTIYCNRLPSVAVEVQ